MTPSKSPFAKLNARCGDLHIPMGQRLLADIWNWEGDKP
jgi:hypothetical protein